MKIVVYRPRDGWHPEAVRPPQVDPKLHRMSCLQRAAESFRYVLLRWEHWASPTGDIREWMRHNSRLGAWLLIPAVIVMPAIGLILWQLSGWLTMLTSIAGHLIMLPILVLLALAMFRMIKR